MKWRKAAVYSRFHKKLLDTYLLSIHFLFPEKKVWKNSFIFLFVCLFEQQMISRLIFKEKKIWDQKFFSLLQKMTEIKNCKLFAP